MSPRRPTLAAVVRTRQGRFHCQVATSTEQRRVLSDITACRTQALGGHVFECDQCDHRKVADNPCGNRHCPQCQAAARAEWLDKRLSDLLPVVYFHVVFTLPHQLGPLALQNRRIVYGILFRAVTETLLEVGETRLAAHFGFLTVLHTFSRGAAETGAAGVSACFDRRPRPIASAIVGVMKFFSGYPQSKLSSEIVGWTAEYRQGRSGERSPNSKSALPDLPVVGKLSLA